MRGAIRARPTGPTLETLELGAEVEVGPADGPRRRLVLEARTANPPGLILSFAGVTTREQAAELAGGAIQVPADRLPPLADPDTLYVRELVGFAVEAGGRPLGTVRSVIPGPANDVLEVAGEGEPVLVPFTADAVTAIDRAARRIALRPDLLAD
ncbi:MAG: rRNA processing protein RimM [Miltoncostaeaceae bacterium]|nr:rRNA processing protein RimM [Miltoncostaeaceae bacterium]